MRAPALLAVNSLSAYPAGQPLEADDILEYHAARLLVLIHLCGGTAGLIGLTKLAKLDFFVRYPRAFAEVCVVLKKAVAREDLQVGESEAPMIRHHYGPWDPRYYQVLGFLDATELCNVTIGMSGAISFVLTDAGHAQARALLEHPEYTEIGERVRRVKRTLGRMTGESLKNLVYKVFDKDVALRPIGSVITA